MFDSFAYQHATHKERAQVTDSEGKYPDSMLRDMMRRDLEARIRIALRLSPHAYKRYGLTEEDVRRILAAQDVKCAVCRASFEVMRFDTDHNHNTGRVRGLLCHRCNVQIVRDELWIRAAYAYITKED